ncbi:MAG TPA: hypothetical protein VN495_00915 [Candidatus Paceibacterota bacterium]|nr:hypothetical protein [Candidatus Paceibacterota bacterium]
MANIIVVGPAGNVGSELCKQLAANGDRVILGLSRRKVNYIELGRPCTVELEAVEAIETLSGRFGRYLKEADVAMLAIPNGNKGLDELAYMRLFAEQGIPVVTCAKAAHAYQYPEVLKLGPIGNSACVGGGTDMLNALERRQLQNQNILLDAIVNGTTNNIWSDVQQGTSPIGAIGDAKALGYAEPGSTDNVKIINGELDDVAMKASIIHNTTLSDGEHFITPDHFKIDYFRDEEDIHRLSRRNARHRLVLTFAAVPDYDREYEPRPEGIFGSLQASCGRWSISGRFYNVAAESHWFDWLREVDGVKNGWRIYPRSKDGPYEMSGPGAGPEVTAAGMVRDRNRLRTKR